MNLLTTVPGDDPPKSIFLAACNPAEPAIADDGLPFLAERSAFLPFSDEIRDATPFNHVSMDYQSCGHPPFDVFTKPHYDFHIYHVSTEDRSHMTCDMLPGAPICAFGADAQTSDAGKAFYDPVSTTVSGFQVGIDTALPFSGIHYWNQEGQPSSAAEWTEPFFITGSYGGAMIFSEPMLPIETYTGPEDKTYSETLTYEGEDIPGLPKQYDYSYDAASGFLTITISDGIAKNCAVVPEVPDVGTGDGAGDGDTSAAVIVRGGLSAIAAGAAAVFALN